MNYYLRNVKPRLVYDEYHVAKRSAGWKPLYQANPAIDIRSMEDIRNAVESGDFLLVDEYGEEVALETLVALGEKFVFEEERGIDLKSHLDCGTNAYLQDDGTEWTQTEFFDRRLGEMRRLWVARSDGFGSCASQGACR